RRRDLRDRRRRVRASARLVDVSLWVGDARICADRLGRRDLGDRRGALVLVFAPPAPCRARREHQVRRAGEGAGAVTQAATLEAMAEMGEPATQPNEAASAKPATSTTFIASPWYDFVWFLAP